VIRISVKVIPKSRRSELKFEGNTLKVWLKSAPEDGKANEELVRTLADKLEISLSEIKLTRRVSSRNKTVDISGITLEEIKKAVD
jgi:uncharacterized protein YggU (UPF0235/DUF167 family)